MAEDEKKPHAHEKTEKSVHDHAKEKGHEDHEAKASETKVEEEKKAEEKAEDRPVVVSKKKKHPKPAPKVKVEGEKKESDEVVEEEKRPKKIKPQIDERTRKALLLKNEMARKRRKFKHQQWNLSMEMDRTGWRKPRGKYSKLRHHQVSQGDVVSIGYRGPALARGMHPSGFREVLVHNVKELLNVDAKLQAVRIAAAVGGRKREEIENRADELRVRVLNKREDPDHKIVNVRSVAELEELSPERHSLFVVSNIAKHSQESIRDMAKEKGFKVLNPSHKKVRR